MPRTSSSRSSTASRAIEGKTLVIGGDGRYYNREVIQIAHQDGRGQRLRPGASSGRAASCRRRPPRTSSASTRPSAASSCRPATIPAGRTRISASSTISAMAARRRRRSPTRSSRAPRRSASYRIADVADDRPRHDRHAEAGGMTRRGDRPGRRLCRADGDAVRLRRPSAPCSQAASACASTPCTRSPAPMPRRSSRTGSARPTGTVAQRHAAAGFRRPSPRPQPGPRQAALRRDDGRRTRRTSAPPPTATATAT